MVLVGSASDFRISYSRLEGRPGENFREHKTSTWCVLLPFYETLVGEFVRFDCVLFCCFIYYRTEHLPLSILMAQNVTTPDTLAADLVKAKRLLQRLQHTICMEHDEGKFCVYDAERSKQIRKLTTQIIEMQKLASLFEQTPALDYAVKKYWHSDQTDIF